MTDQRAEMARDVATAGLHSAPGVIGSILSILTLNNIVAFVTLVFLCLQIAYLLWKWRREVRAHRRHAHAGKLS